LNTGGQDRPRFWSMLSEKIFGDCLGNIEFDSKSRPRRFDRYVVAGCRARAFVADLGRATHVNTFELEFPTRTAICSHHGRLWGDRAHTRAIIKAALLASIGGHCPRL
jgi:hypothetical protein